MSGRVCLLIAGALVLLSTAGCSVAGEPHLPGVVGMSVERASNALEAAGFHVIQVAPNHSGRETTHVVDAYVPEVSGMGGDGRGVVILVGTMDGENVTTPSVLGGGVATAKETLRSWGLTLGSLQARFDSSVTSGTVLSQDPAAGTVSKRNTPVSLVLSTDKR